jgi:DNA polymerase III delta prime subunit
MFAANPYPTAFIFEGETGTGKTSAALALAVALGCDLSQKEFGGVQAIASGEQSADTVREAYRQMFNTPWHGSGWKVVIVNEADRMARPAETIWLDVLEAIPARTVIIFTTNEAARLSQRFLDRCTRLAFESDGRQRRANVPTPPRCSRLSRPRSLRANCPSADWCKESSLPWVSLKDK